MGLHSGIDYAKQVAELDLVADDQYPGYSRFSADLERSVVVHVRDSSLPPDQAFFQERPIGPPDPEEEKRKQEEADERRAEAAAAQPADLAPAAAAGG